MLQPCSISSASRALLWACSLAASAQAFAGSVELFTVDPATGQTASWVVGELEHRPVQLVEIAEPYLIDACGDVHRIELDRTGSRPARHRYPG